MRTVAFLAISSILAAAPGARHELANDRVVLALDGEGRLAELTNRHTGHRYLAKPGHPLWRMYYRTAEAHELEIPAASQQAEVRREGNSLVVAYRTLKGDLPLQGASRELQVSLSLRVSLEGDRLTWTAAIENREKQADLEISELWLPWLYGLGDLGLGRAADKLYWPEDGGRRITDPYSKLLAGAAAPGASRFRFEPAYRITYPWPASMQWYTLNNGEEGLYVASYDQSLMTTTLNVTAHSGDGLSVSMVKYPFVKAGETWTSAPTVMRLYKGDWHEAARGYRAWADTWMRKPDPPKWMRRMNGWIIPNLKAQNGSRYNGVYADLPQYFRDAHAVGIDMVSIYGWEKQGFDNLYPEYDPDPGMGGESGLKAAIAEIQKAGGKAFLYSQGQLIDPATEYYRRIGHRQTAKDIWGYEYRETYGGRGRGTLLNIMRNKLFGVACPLAPGWYEQLASQFDMAVKYGVSGLMYDQIGGRPPYICFAKDHRHSKPSLACGPGKAENMQRLRELIKSRDPEFAFLHELVVDVYSGYGDITQPVGYGFTPGPESFGEMFKYTFPEPIITNRTGSDRKAHFGFGFSLQWRVDGMMRDTTDPVMGPYLARLNQLRSQFADLLLEGRFVDNEGFLCDNSSVPAHAYVAGDRLAVTLWNPTDTAQKARLLVPGYSLESAHWQDPKWSGAEHLILPGDVAVMVFRRP